MLSDRIKLIVYVLCIWWFVIIIISKKLQLYCNLPLSNIALSLSKDVTSYLPNIKEYEAGRPQSRIMLVYKVVSAVLRIIFNYHSCKFVKRIQYTEALLGTLEITKITSENKSVIIRHSFYWRWSVSVYSSLRPVLHNQATPSNTSLPCYRPKLPCSAEEQDGR